MVVAGDHARNDLAGEEPDSWKSALEGAGYQWSVTCGVWGSSPASSGCLPNTPDRRQTIGSDPFI